MNESSPATQFHVGTGGRAGLEHVLRHGQKIQREQLSAESRARRSVADHRTAGRVVPRGSPTTAVSDRVQIQRNHQVRRGMGGFSNIAGKLPTAPEVIAKCLKTRGLLPIKQAPGFAICNICSLGRVLVYGNAETRPDERSGNEGTDGGDCPCQGG